MTYLGLATLTGNVIFIENKNYDPKSPAIYTCEHSEEG